MNLRLCIVRQKLLMLTHHWTRTKHCLIIQFVFRKGDPCDLGTLSHIQFLQQRRGRPSPCKERNTLGVWGQHDPQRQLERWRKVGGVVSPAFSVKRSDTLQLQASVSGLPVPALGQGEVGSRCLEYARVGLVTSLPMGNYNMYTKVEQNEVWGWQG